MKARKVKELMVPLEEYATVPRTATLLQAVLALETAQDDVLKDRRNRYLHRAILVTDEKGETVVGKISQFDVLKALEPRYKEITDFKHSMSFGFSKDFIRSMIDTYSLWERPLDDICGKAHVMVVEDVMYAPEEGEYVDQEATCNEAIHQLIIGHHQSLLVTGANKRVVGVLRLTDVFTEVCKIIKSCM